ncbi:hypothetical protein [Burkholderia sp. S171]|uniref:hypothetical protein n=1 Tax=Burkholderia sp. S171 TaxID=1641860 RepID=UPI00131B5BDA|nr:hypothetical protein [Burkholderia sp. S171]
MTILIRVNNPAALLKAIKNDIDTNKIETWTYDSDGDFCHTPPQWLYKAWLRPTVEAGALRLTLIQNKNQVLTKVVYGVYHGRFIEMLLAHFEDDFSSVETTARQPHYLGV